LIPYMPKVTLLGWLCVLCANNEKKEVHIP
jgi:hypothetical protein